MSDLKTDYYKKTQKILLIILAANFLVAALKITVGTIIHSVSMTADGFHSLSDGSSNIVGLIGIKLASKPKDACHPYGHEKFETLTGLCIGTMLLFIGGSVVYKAIGWFSHPVVPSITISSLLVLLFTLMVNIFVTAIEHKKGKEMNSTILISDAMHTRSDIFVSCGVLLTLVGVKLGLPPVIDPLVSFVVAGFIFHAAYEVFKENGNVLVDKAPFKEDVIMEIIKEFSAVKGVHNVCSRGTRNNIYVEAHIMVDPIFSIEASHALEHSIEEKLRETLHEGIHFLGHMEPYEEISEDDSKG